VADEKRSAFDALLKEARNLRKHLIAAVEAEILGVVS
jgi:hypothetical protein